MLFHPKFCANHFRLQQHKCLGPRTTFPSCSTGKALLLGLQYSLRQLSQLLVFIQFTQHSNECCCSSFLRSITYHLSNAKLRSLPRFYCTDLVFFFTHKASVIMQAHVATVAFAHLLLQCTAGKRHEFTCTYVLSTFVHCKCTWL